MNLSRIQNILLAVAILCLAGCTEPPIPPEIKQAEEQALALWRSEVPVYLPEEYGQYKKTFIKAKANFIREKSRLIFFRNYTHVQSEYRQLLQTGNSIIVQLEGKKQEFSRKTEEKLSFLGDQIETLKRLSKTMNEGRLARRNLIQAEVILIEAKKRFERGDFIGADEKTPSLAQHIKAAEKTLYPIVTRYSDKKQIGQWQQWFDDTIAESRTRKIPVIVINKSERTLTLYKRGNAAKSYKIGLGRNGSKDKIHAGDYATPEGRYKIIKKLPRSRYHKALLINYPNEDDRRQFEFAKKKGLIPRTVSIGGLIEIHGGGKDSMTYGCIAMDNQNINELYGLISVGTPVTIIGAVDARNRFSSGIQGK
ncbi:MAG: L,D-transpeptidase [Thermodesulfovibrionales bacterium]|nr:L,D-transpeptidase [Thermodesulfovibrionales bacterium]